MPASSAMSVSPYSPLASIGWGVVKASPDPKWLAVKDERLPKNTTDAKSMQAVHDFARRSISYRKDIGDEWKGPARTLKDGFGDCEDICILERALLLNAGYRQEDTELMIVRDLITREDHALLWVKEHYLDNRTAQVLHVSQFKDYRPIMGHRAGLSYVYGRVAQ